jgi:hypothetical protein
MPEFFRDGITYRMWLVGVRGPTKLFAAWRLFSGPSMTLSSYFAESAQLIEQTAAYLSE